MKDRGRLSRIDISTQVILAENHNLKDLFCLHRPLPLWCSLHPCVSICIAAQKMRRRGGQNRWRSTLRAAACLTPLSTNDSPCGSQAGSYSRLIDSCFTQLKAQGPSRTCNESREEEQEEDKKKKIPPAARGAAFMEGHAPFIFVY